MADFDVDVKTGEGFENRAIKLLSSRFKLVKWRPGEYAPEYDLVCTETGTKIECKTCSRVNETGNIIIETKALRLCEADLFLYEDALSGYIYWAKWPELKYWIELAVEIGDYQERVVGENNTLGYIVPLEHTIAYMNKWRIE